MEKINTFLIKTTGFILAFMLFLYFTCEIFPSLRREMYGDINIYWSLILLGGGLITLTAISLFFLKFFEYIHQILNFISDHIVVAVCLFALCSVIYANNSKNRNLEAAESKQINNIMSSCSLGEIDCVRSINSRILQIRAGNFLGTGFIVNGDKDFLTIATATHVIGDVKTDNNIVIHTYDSNRNGHTEDAVRWCYFGESQYADLTFIKVKNYTNTIFEQVTFSEPWRGEVATVIDNKHSTNTRLWKYKINGVNNNLKSIRLLGQSEHGMSGSPIVGEDGSLLGILISGNYYYTFGTTKLKDALAYGIDYMYEHQNYFAPYRCK